MFALFVLFEKEKKRGFFRIFQKKKKLSKGKLQRPVARENDKNYFKKIFFFNVSQEFFLHPVKNKFRSIKYRKLKRKTWV